MVHASAMAPWRLTNPYVGRNPVTPQLAEGPRMDPEVSEPIPNGTNPAATAMPVPLDDPPDQCPGFQGFLPGPCRDAEG